MPTVTSDITDCSGKVCKKNVGNLLNPSLPLASGIGLYLKKKKKMLVVVFIKHGTVFSFKFPS